MNRATAPTNINTRRDILHPDLRVDYRFGVDDTTGIPTGSISRTMAVDTSLEARRMTRQATFTRPGPIDW